jgi:hypothetical protein
VRLEDTKDFVTSDEAHLGDTMRVTESDTDLGRGKALAGELSDVLDDIFLRGLEPRRLVTAVRKGRGR